MKSFFIREVVPPDLERRNYLLRKLATLRGVSPPVEGTQNIIKLLRRQLKATDGYVNYYRFQKGVKVFIGDSLTPKKNFILTKDPRYLEPFVKTHRAKFKSPARRDRQKTHLRKVDLYLDYYKVGGVMEQPDYFKAQDHKVKRKKAVSAKYPQTKDPYIGIEIEYASRIDIDAIVDQIIQLGLQDTVRVMRDTSIRTNTIYPHQVEFCILTKWSELKETLNKLKPLIFDKPQNFSPNDSCGLHVHLDMRHDEVRKVFSNLTAMQSLLFQLVNETRRDNRYCQPVYTQDFDEVDDSEDDAHYHAISKFAYNKHETIEVRMHHSTLNLTHIEKWITLLKRIADYRGDRLKLGTVETEFAQLKDKVKPELELIQYVEERKSV